VRAYFQAIWRATLRRGPPPKCLRTRPQRVPPTRFGCGWKPLWEKPCIRRSLPFAKIT